MSDTMKVQSFTTLMDWILKEYEENKSVFGINEFLFYRPQKDSAFAQENVFGHYLATPLGPAAGPHTQMTQNIICSWLTGCRFIELKTVQVMDDLEIPRPCIDMEDEGYNVEWSQELSLEESATEYIKSWVLIFVLRRLLGFENETPFGTIFNMSVGYNLEGIQSPTMVRFMDRLNDASTEIKELQDILAAKYPRFAGLEIPSQLTNNVSLSTMHGCPPDEIERIASHLLVDRGLNTAVKLNPTLLGQETVHRILHDDCGFDKIWVTDKTFANDLPYDRALSLIKTLKETAATRNLTFGVKLSNTLPAANHKDVLPGEEMYMSGRTLFPLTVNLFNTLMKEFDGDLNVSFSGGADALNITDLLASGIYTVTAVSDVLKPGGYGRFLQYLENLSAEMETRGAANLTELASNKMNSLDLLAADSLTNLRYNKAYQAGPLPKVNTALPLFDCVEAPCMDRCPVTQDVPRYAALIAEGNYDKALEVILERNPLPGITGYICTHACQTKCTRSEYDEPVAIRALKRFAFEHGKVKAAAVEKTAQKVAVVGAGPSGLAAAAFLAVNGVQTTIFEAREAAGGMCHIAPGFRVPAAVVQEDVERIVNMGVEIKYSQPVTDSPEMILAEGYDAVYLACGFQKDAPLNIDGFGGEGVFKAIDLLEQIKLGQNPELGSKVLVIGGGNTAMDAARTAQRLIGKPVKIVYRRTRAEMPADAEEICDLLDEGNTIDNLLTPVRIVLEQGKVVALECQRNELGDADADGRRKPVSVPGSEFLIEADSVIVAIGQTPELTFLNETTVGTRKNGAIVVNEETGEAAENIYAGGDVSRGPATIIEACADGWRAAEAICEQFGLQTKITDEMESEFSAEDLQKNKLARTRKSTQHKQEMTPVSGRDGFGLVDFTLTEEAARAEAARCLQCSLICEKCTEVCPNRANYAYTIETVDWQFPILNCANGQVVKGELESFVVDQERQIVHLDDYCNECGNCSTFCVHEGRPYAEKPRLFLRKSDFLLESDNAYYIERNTIFNLTDGHKSQLTIDNGIVEYFDDQLKIVLSNDFDIREIELKKSFGGTFSLRTAAGMALLLTGVNESLSFLNLYSEDQA